MIGFAFLFLFSRPEFKFCCAKGRCGTSCPIVFWVSLWATWQVIWLQGWVLGLGWVLSVKNRNVVLSLHFMLTLPPGRQLGLSWTSVPSLTVCRPLSATLADGMNADRDVGGRLRGSRVFCWRLWFLLFHLHFLPCWAKRQWDDSWPAQEAQEEKESFVLFKPLLFEFFFFPWWEELEGLSSRWISATQSQTVLNISAVNWSDLALLSDYVIQTQIFPPWWIAGTIPPVLFSSQALFMARISANGKKERQMAPSGWAGSVFNGVATWFLKECLSGERCWQEFDFWIVNMYLNSKQG